MVRRRGVAAEFIPFCTVESKFEYFIEIMNQLDQYVHLWLPFILIIISNCMLIYKLKESVDAAQTDVATIADNHKSDRKKKVGNEFLRSIPPPIYRPARPSW